MDTDHSVRQHLIELLDGGYAHVEFAKAVAQFPVDQRGKKIPDIPYTAWQLLEHVRIAQWDIVEFTIDPAHVSPDWPDGYWPKEATPPTERSWDESIASFKDELAKMTALVRDPSTDLHTPLPHGDGQTVLREALTLADHNAYHLGEFVVIRRLLGIWK